MPSLGLISFGVFLLSVSDLFCFVCVFVLSCIVLCFILLLSLEASSFRDIKGVESEGREGGEELGEVEKVETIIRIYCMQKCIFSKRKMK